MRFVIFAAMAGSPRGLALRAAGLRRPGPHLRRRVRAGAGGADRAVPARQRGTTPSCDTRSIGLGDRAPRSASGILVGASFLDGVGPARRVGPGPRCSTSLGPFLFGVRGVEARARPLRRAPRPDLPRSRSGSRSSRSASGPRRAWMPASSPPPCSASCSQPRCGGPTSTSSRSSPTGGCRSSAVGRRRTRWRATPTRSSTSRWWPGSCSSRSGLKQTLHDLDEPLRTEPAFALVGGAGALPALPRGLPPAGTCAA